MLLYDWFNIYTLLKIFALFCNQPIVSGGSSAIQLNVDSENFKYLTINSTLTLSCNNRINSEPITWHHPKIPPERVEIRHGVNSTLTVDNATNSDSGIYRCITQHTLPNGRKVDIEEIRIVTVKPDNALDPWIISNHGNSDLCKPARNKQVAAPDTQNGAQRGIDVNYDDEKKLYKCLKRNENFQLICENHMNDEFVEWTCPNNINNECGDHVKIQRGTRSILTVPNATDIDAGIYRCTIPFTKPDGTVVDVKQIIIVAVEPMITLNENIMLHEGDKLELNCTATGAIFDSWKIEHYDKTQLNNQIGREECTDDNCEDEKNEICLKESKYPWKIESNFGISKSRLVIDKVTVHDSGKYFCQFKDIAGSTQKYAEVIVKEADTTSTISSTWIIIICVLSVCLISISCGIIYLIYWLRKKQHNSHGAATQEQENQKENNVGVINGNTVTTFDNSKVFAWKCDDE